MYNKFVLTVISAMLALVTTSAIAGPSVDESRSMDATGELNLSVVEGELTVRGWDNDSFELTGELGSDKHKVVITGDEDDWDIEVRQDGNWNWKWGRKGKGRTDLVLSVPHAAKINLEAVSTEVEVEGLDGDHLGIETVSGDVDIVVSSAHLDLGSVSGDIDIRGDGSRLELETVSGDVRASGIFESAEIESVSGDLRVSASDLEDLHASTVSGDVIIDTNLVSGARVGLDTHSGEIDLMLPAGTRFDLDSDTFSGDVDNEFGSDSSSDISIDAETFSGNITIKRK